MQAAVVLFHLNRLIGSEFFANFVVGREFKSDVSFTPEEKPFALWLLHRLELTGVPGQSYFEILGMEIRDVHMLNKLILIQRYRRYLSGESPRPYQTNNIAYRWYAEHRPVKDDLEAAGYRVDKKYDFSPFLVI